MDANGNLSVGQRIQRERTRLNWSQERLAEEIGTTARSINRWEHDKAVPQYYYQEQLCRVFQISVTDLFAAEENQAERAEKCSRIWHVPYQRNSFFTGREAILSHLHSILVDADDTAVPPPQAISGLGGIGKTQTALEYAYRYRESYSAVFWTRAETRAVLIADFGAIANLLHLPEKDEQDQQRIVKAVKRWLDRHIGWLFIFDNVEDMSLVRLFFPAEHTGHILLTTRTQSTGGVAETLSLEQMEREEGALLLLRRAKLMRRTAFLKNIGESLRTDAQRISEALDGLPLALDQAGAYIEETGCHVADYLALFSTHATPLLQRRGKNSEEHPDSVNTTFTLCFEQVERESPLAAEILQLCAFLAAEAIPEEILNSAPFEVDSPLQLLASNSLLLDEALAILRRYSLLRRDAETRLLTIHRLVQAVLKDRMDEATQRLWAERTVRIMSRIFPENRFVDKRRGERYLPHALACASLVQQWNLLLPEASRLLHCMGEYLRVHARYTLAEKLFQQALSIQKQIWGDSHIDVASALNDLGVLAIDQKSYAKAEVLFQEVVAIRKRVLGPEHLDVARSLSNLAVLWGSQGKYAQAEPLFRETLAIFQHVLGSEHFQVMKAFGNLGDLCSRQGNYLEAETLIREALALSERDPEWRYPYVAGHLYMLAQNTMKQGKCQQAEPLFQQTLAIQEQALGLDHPDVAECLHALGQLYCKQEKYTQAEALFKRALAILEQAEKEPLLLTQVLEDYAILLLAADREVEAAQVKARARMEQTQIAQQD